MTKPISFIGNVWKLAAAAISSQNSLIASAADYPTTILADGPIAYYRAQLQ